MSIFIQNHGLLNGIHSIPEDMRNCIMVCVQNTKTFGSEESIKAADTVEAYIKFYNETEVEQDAVAEIVDHLTKEQEEILKDIHALDYHGTDDDMPDAYENWLADLTSQEIKKYLGL